MRQETAHYFTEKEEEFANLFIEIGMKTNTAKILVFLASITEATSRAIERGLDMRQPEVVIAMKSMLDRGWVRSRESTSGKGGRPMKIYELAKPIIVPMVRPPVQVKCQHLPVIQLVDVIAGEDQHVLRALGLQQVRFWKMESAVPRYQRLTMICWGGME